MNNYLHKLTTEEVNKQTLNIDECSTLEMLRLINEQDAKVALAVKNEIPNIAKAVDLIYELLKNGGRMFYVGAGTSGRLGILDASECPPTYGTDPSMVQAFIAGGDIAFRIAVEGSEDDIHAGAKLIEDHNIGSQDVIIGITASGCAPYVLSAMRTAREKGIATIGITNNSESEISKICDICIAPIVGPEVIIGSTRMKAGTAQKIVLNMLTTSVMIKLGKVYGNLMVDLKATNTKLCDRARRIICHATAVDYKTAEKYLKEAGGNTKLAILLIKTGLDIDRAKHLMEKYNGRLKDAIRAAN